MAEEEGIDVASTFDISTIEGASTTKNRVHNENEQEQNKMSLPKDENKTEADSLKSNKLLMSSKKKMYLGIFVTFIVTMAVGMGLVTTRNKSEQTISAAMMSETASQDNCDETVILLKSSTSKSSKHSSTDLPALNVLSSQAESPILTVSIFIF